MTSGRFRVVLDRLRRVPRQRFIAATVALALIALVAVAWRNEGVATTRVDVNDGGIWVTNAARQLVGHLNYDTRTLDGALRTPSAMFDIAQYRDQVTLDDQAVNTITTVDAAGVRLGVATSLPERTHAVQGGQRLGVLDSGKGMLWVGDAANPAGIPLSPEGAVANDLAGGVVTAGVDGTVAALAGKSAQFVIVSRTGMSDAVSRVAVKGLSPTAQLQITMVGSRPVALDPATNTLVLPDGSTRSLAADGVPTGAVLQQPGPDADHVLLATPTTLVQVPLAGGNVRQSQAASPDQGRPAAPVRLNGCEYSAWTGSGAFLRQCDQGDPLVMTVDTLKSSQGVVFRTNRNLIVLNDIGNGTVWLPDKNMMLAAEWDKIDSQVKEQETEEESPQVSDQVIDPERKTTNTPPVATEDKLGVRPGRSTTLDVLSNDSDADGDPLTAHPVNQPSIGPVMASRGGQALRIDVPENASGKVATFTYEASDGLAVTTAQATVSVHPWSQNLRPEQIHRPSVKLGSNAEVSYNLLPNWRDPDGDPIFLSGVGSVDGLQVQFREEGTVTVRNLGAKPGLIPVKVTVSDGTLQAEGTLNVLVAPSGNVPPVANADFYVGRVGEDVLLQPLANDTDANADILTMVRVAPAPNHTSAVANLDVGSITFSARTPGSYYLTYGVTDGPDQASGVIRVDIVSPQQSTNVVAEDDLVLLTKGGSALAAPLNNDSDPSGGVLVLQSVDTSHAQGLKLTLVDHHLLRIASQQVLEAPATISYVASNGTSTASAKVTIVPTALRKTNQPPNLQPDRGKARVNDIASVDVLANDRSPAGLKLTLDPQLEYSPKPEVGTPFVTGNQVRLRAGGQPGFLKVSYSVRDTAGNLATSTVLFEVVGADAPNSAPRPVALTAWAVSGQKVRIPVPLAGIDPDGDSVTLVGIGQPPKKGLAALGTEWLEYTPAPDQSGSDVFTYVVEDRLGKQAVARVRVGVAPPSATNSEPSTEQDVVATRPGRTVTVPVLDNDVDPDGDTLSVVPDSAVSNQSSVVAKVVGSSVAISAPQAEGTYVVSYRAADGRGGFDTGLITLTVSKDAPALAPQARDDVVSAAAVPLDGSPVKVDVMANDADPDGSINDLKLASTDTGVQVVNGRLQITPNKERRLVVYTITDSDNLTGTAVVSVPGTQNARPRLDDSKVPLEMRAGQQLSINLRELVVVRDNRSVHANDAATLRASLGFESAPQLPDDHTVVVKAATDFAGDAAITVEVSDGTADDRSALNATVTIPIRIISAINHPPTITPTPLRVAMGEEAIEYDLSLAVRDPDNVDPTTFAYTLISAPKGISVSLPPTPGRVLQVQAPVDHPKGLAGNIVIGVDDGSGVVQASIQVFVVSSTRPLVQISDSGVQEGNAGGMVKVDITRFTQNPFPKVPLRIGKIQVLSGEVVSADGSGSTTLQVSLPTAYHGDVVISYQVIDATNDPSRIVSGKIRIFVRDRPDPPTSVIVETTGVGEALVVFQPGPDNGAPVDRYVITDTVTKQEWTSDSPRKQLSNLKLGIKHAFTARAHNEIGDSDPSEASAEVLIDVEPGRPDPPKVHPGDQEITVDWKAPANQGSAINAYTLYLSGASSRKISLTGSETSTTITGLSNGESYRVAVQAHNLSEQPSKTSEPSDSVVPFGKPPGTASISAAVRAPDSASMSKVEISWSYPGDSNGRPWDQVKLKYAGGEDVIDSDGSVTSKMIEVPVSLRSEVSVSLHTEGGWSEAHSFEFQAPSVPVAIDKPIVKATGENGQLEVIGARTKPGNGYMARQLKIQYSTGGSWYDLDSDLINGLSNGDSVTVKFRQVGNVLGTETSGAETSAEPATPYGPPLKPELSGTDGTGEVSFHWRVRASNGGPVVKRLVLSVSGRGDVVIDTSSANAGDILDDSRVFTAGVGETVTATISACYASGSDNRCTSSESATAQAK